MQKIMFEI